MEAGPLVSAITQIMQGQADLFNEAGGDRGEEGKITMADWVHPAYRERWEVEDCTGEM